MTAHPLLRGLALGIGAAAPIGPVNVELARRTLRGGFWPGFALGCGAVTVDVLYMVLSSLGTTLTVKQPALLLAISIGGILLLTWLGVMSIRAAIRDWHADPLANPEPAPSPHAGYLTGVLMTLLNPITLAFWFLEVPTLLATGTSDPIRRLPIVCLGVFLATIGWVICFAGLLAFAGRWRRNWWLAAADFAGGIVLLAFALGALWRWLSPLL